MSETGQKLIVGATETDSELKPFILTHRDFVGNSLPSLKASGLGAGDSVRVWEWIDDNWFMTDKILDDNTVANNSIAITSTGKYAIDLIIASETTVSVVLNSSAR